MVKSKCRIVCSTNRDLREMVKEGSFRLDLFHRISVFVIQTTPLRDRPDDLALYIKKQGFDNPKEITEKILKLTPLYGNYRELQSILARYKLLGELINY